MPDTDVWVGTWRPHKTRGPIAALYGSPGPKYALPGLLGITNHDPRKNQAPIFSFGTRHDLPKADTSPGPKYLIPAYITRVGRSGTPAFSLYSRARDPKLFLVPGPGQYSPEQCTKSVYYAAPAFSLSARSREFNYDKTPGPAAYMLPPVLGANSVNKTSSPNYSISGRNKFGSCYEDMKKTPGPGTYCTVDTGIYKYKAPQYSMTGRNSACGDNTKKPGPGAHHPEQVTCTTNQAPRFSFGVRHSQYIAPLIVDAVNQVGKQTLQY